MLALAVPLAAEDQDPSALAITGPEAEAFLHDARVTDTRATGKGSAGAELARPARMTLTDGTRTLHGAWKTIDVHKPGPQRMAGGWEFDFRDSWKSEVAAYELDKLLGLGLVPPTVERRIDGRVGALQLSVEQALTEEDRRKQNLQPPHLPRWNNQLYNLRLLQQLTRNSEYQNVRNVLVERRDFHVYAIENSRAFRVQTTLLAPDDLACFSRSVLEKLKALDQPTLERQLGKWLDPKQIEGLLGRRDAILALVEKRIAEKGEGVVLFY